MGGSSKFPCKYILENLSLESINSLFNGSAKMATPLQRKTYKPKYNGKSIPIMISVAKEVTG